MTLKEFHREFERQIREAGGVRRLAQRLRVSPAYVSDIRLGKRDPGPSILNAMGYKMERRVVRTFSPSNANEVQP